MAVGSSNVAEWLRRQPAQLMGYVRNEHADMCITDTRAQMRGKHFGPERALAFLLSRSLALSDSLASNKTTNTRTTNKQETYTKKTQKKHKKNSPYWDSNPESPAP